MTNASSSNSQQSSARASIAPPSPPPESQDQIIHHSVPSLSTLPSLLTLNKLTSPPDCFYQYSFLSAYTAGAVSDGPPVSFLTQYGDYAYGFFPCGTPLALIDSQPYIFTQDGEADKADAEAPVAFAMICLFHPQNRIVTGGGDTVGNLRETLGRGQFGYDGRNSPVVFAVRGAFKLVKLKFGVTFEDVQGVVCGFALPGWMEAISGKGFRCVFVSGCKRLGGEVLDFDSIQGSFVEWSVSENVHMGLPWDAKFETMEL